MQTSNSAKKYEFTPKRKRRLQLKLIAKLELYFRSTRKPLPATKATRGLRVQLCRYGASYTAFLQEMHEAKQIYVVDTLSGSRFLYPYSALRINSIAGINLQVQDIEQTRRKRAARKILATKERRKREEAVKKAKERSSHAKKKYAASIGI